MPAAINIQIDWVLALALSDSAAKGCYNTAMKSRCFGLLAPVFDTPGGCGAKRGAVLDVFPLSKCFLMAQCLHTVTVLSTIFLPSSSTVY